MGTEGSNTGPGAVYPMDPNMVFRPGEKYAISFVSPGKDIDAMTVLKGTTAVIATVGSVLAVIQTGGLGLIPILALTTAGGTTGSTLTSGSLNDINYIVISTYDDVNEFYTESED